MTEAPFIHLRVHSAYSLAEGAIKIGDLVTHTRAMGMPAIAVTDTNNLFGALEFSSKAAGSGIQPIIGIQIDVERLDSGAAADRHRLNGAGGELGPAVDRLVLLAQDEAGYRNLMALVSAAQFGPGGEAGHPHLAWRDFDARTEGLICLTGGPDGPLGRPLAEDRPEAAAQALDRLLALFPGRLYVELQRHGLPLERKIEPGLLDLAYDRDVPLVATNDVYFATPDMHEAHDCLLCIADGAYVGEERRRRVSTEHYLKSSAEMAALFADLPEAVANTAVIARRCHVMVEQVDPILPAFPTVGGRSEAEELRAQAAAGLEARLSAQVYTAEMDDARREEVAQPYRDRLDYELGVIAQMGFPGYFLIVADFIQWAKEAGIPVGPGRGSGAGSVVAWALTITDLDPLRFGLLFERFLNPERVSMPDFDIDFCQDRRDEVIAYVRDKYGADRVAQIITFTKLQARAVLRDVGRVLQLPFGQVDRICKLVPNNPANPTTLARAIEEVDQLREERDRDPAVAHMIAIALKLEGLNRNASTHAAGVVIGDRPLDELVPLYRDPRSGMRVTQFNMKDVEKAGLVKFDFLGLKTLTVLKQAVDLIRDAGTPIAIETIPFDDPATYEMLARAESRGVFQLEGAGMRDTLRRMRPDRIEDIIALVALYRPGPMDNIPTYIAVKNGEQQPDFLYPTLEPILRETHGIMIYQEQVMQVAQELAGYTLGGADLLRRAMGKKIREEMEAQKKSFVDGAVSRGVPEARASMIFDQVAKFAGYGFNKSHAAAYAVVAYQTGYLKANYQVEFLAASMTLDIHSTDKLGQFRQELRRLEIPVLPPDVNRSQALFSVETVTVDGEPRKAIRYALGAVKNVGIEAMATLVAEREANGPFESVYDLMARVDPKALNKRQIENLVRAGALDALNPNRAQLLAAADLLARYAHTAHAERASDQSSLFGGAGEGGGLAHPRLPDEPPWDDLEALSQEFDAVGFYLSGHPLDRYKPARVGAVPVAELESRLRAGGGQQVRMAGIVTARSDRRDRNGRPFAFLTLSDATGSFEVPVFSEMYQQHRPLLEAGTALLLTVDVQPDRMNVLAIDSLDRAVSRAGAAFRVDVSDSGAVPQLASILGRLERGRGSIQIRVPVEGGREVTIDLGSGFAVGPDLRAALKSVAGVGDVRELA